jgi:transposase-like protein
LHSDISPYPARQCQVAHLISLIAKGLTTGEVQAHLAEVYGPPGREAQASARSRLATASAIGWFVAASK